MIDGLIYIVFLVVHVLSGDLLLTINLLEKLNSIVIYIVIVLYLFDWFCYFHKQKNIYLMGPNMKLLQQYKIWSMLNDVLKGKAEEDNVKLHNQAIIMFSFIWLNCVLGIYACEHTYI